MYNITDLDLQIASKHPVDVKLGCWCKDHNRRESLWIYANQKPNCPSHFQPGEGPGDCEILANLRFQL